MFRPRYQVSPQLLATVKRVAIQVHELNKQHLAADTTATLRQEAQILSAAAASSGDDSLPLPEVRRLLLARPQTPRRDEQEVLNYRQTLSELGDTPAASFDLGLLLRIHYRLNEGVLADGQRGRLRRERAPAREPESGGGASKMVRYRPPDPQALPHLLHDLVTFVQENQATLDPLLLSGLFHKQLLVIHPFIGGNRATAWLATRILLSGLDLNMIDLIAVGDRFGQDVAGYFDALGVHGNYDEVTHALDFTPWLEYFAKAISFDLAALEKRLQPYQASPATTLRPHHQAILNHINERGFITDRQYARFTDRAKATRSLDFKKLLELGLIVREGRGRGTFYRRKT